MPEFIITDDNRKFDLEKAENLDCSTQECHGVRTIGIWKTKSGKIIVGTDSIWASGRNDGTTVGEGYHIADDNEIATLAKEFDNSVLEDMVPTEE